jgi:hypothetical protein
LVLIEYYTYNKMTGQRAPPASTWPATQTKARKIEGIRSFVDQREPLLDPLRALRHGTPGFYAGEPSGIARVFMSIRNEHPTNEIRLFVETPKLSAPRT